MFRAIIMLDCDKCHQPFWKAATAVEYDDELAGATWGDATNVLMSWSFDSGWDHYRGFYLCKDCIAERDNSNSSFTGLTLHSNT